MAGVGDFEVPRDQSRWPWGNLIFRLPTTGQSFGGFYGFSVYLGFTLDFMLGALSFNQNDDRAVLLLRQDMHSFFPRRYVEGLMMSCRLA